MSAKTKPANPRGMSDIPLAVYHADANEKARARRIAALLREQYPDAHCELDFTNAHELLIATMLSAQCTDVAVNKATPGLFAAFPTPADYAAAEPGDVEPHIRTLGLFRNKAKSVVSAMRDIVEKHGGRVPSTMEDLTALRGVARKTASVVLGNAFAVNDGFVVDTHIQRISQRLGLAPGGSNTLEVEKRLMGLFPRKDWCALSHAIIYHGRRSCAARQKSCGDNPICRRYGQRCELRET